MKKIGIIAIIAAGILAAGTAAAFMSTSAAAPRLTSDAADNNSAEQIEIKLLSPSIESAPALGSADAPITIVEFGDYQCTWCHRFHEGTKDTLVANFVDTGKVRFLFKDYPINDQSDRASSKAAEASYCAADQGKYWEYHDEVYSNWKGENPSPPWITKDSLKEFATSVGIADMEQFSQCLDSGKYAGLVRENYNLARTIELKGTPNFIIMKEGMTPKLIPGAAPYSSFEQILNEINAG